MLIWCTSANLLFILNSNRKHQAGGYFDDESVYEENKLYQDEFNDMRLSAFLNQYLMSTGEYDTGNFSNGADFWLVWVLFIVISFFTQIILLNMLIAIMADSYDYIYGNKK